ncbi:MAG: sec-independent protein translocase protein TatC [Phenylobacterium sp.]|jgi:sec-independent protein translocase protein TatC
MIPPEKPGNSLISHLVELRSRILHVVIAILVIFMSSAYFANDLYELLSKPLTDVLPVGSTMIAKDITAPFIAPFKLTFMLSIFAAIPYILHQLWSFIAPGLYQNEKRLVMPLLVSSTLLFYGGIAFCYLVVFPLVFTFFSSIGPDMMSYMPDITSYLDFVLTLFFAFGVAFEIPVVILLLCWTGVTNAETLKTKRPYVVVGAFVLGMLLTPPDVISQTLLAIPMWLLFEVGLFFSRFYTKKEDDEDDDQQSEDSENAPNA